MNFVLNKLLVSCWMSPTSFHLSNKNSPLTPYAWGHVALLKSDNSHLAKFLLTLLSFFLPLHLLLLFFIRSSTSFLFYSVPLYSRQDKLTRCANNDYKCGVFSLFFFYNGGLLVCWVDDILTPSSPTPSTPSPFLSTIACMCVFARTWFEFSRVWGGR
jgi:hypothetical protein